MKYCTECGHGNPDEVKFCESCGHAFAATEGAVQPVAQQAVADVSAAVKKTSKAIATGGRQRTVLVVSTAGLALILIVWFAFFRPMSASAYESAAEDHLAEIADGLSLISEGVSGLYSYGSDQKMSVDEYGVYRADIEAGVDTATRAAKKLHSLRAPAEHQASDRRLKAFATYILDGAAPAAVKLVADVEPGMTGSRLDDRIGRYFDQVSRGSDRAYESLYRAADDLYIPSGLGSDFNGGY